MKVKGTWRVANGRILDSIKLSLDNFHFFKIKVVGLLLFSHGWNRIRNPLSASLVFSSNFISTVNV